MRGRILKLHTYVQEKVEDCLRFLTLEKRGFLFSIWVFWEVVPCWDQNEAEVDIITKKVKVISDLMGPCNILASMNFLLGSKKRTKSSSKLNFYFRQGISMKSLPLLVCSFYQKCWTYWARKSRLLRFKTWATRTFQLNSLRCYDGTNKIHVCLFFFSL